MGNDGFFYDESADRRLYYTDNLVNACAAAEIHILDIRAESIADDYDPDNVKWHTQYVVIYEFQWRNHLHRYTWSKGWATSTKSIDDAVYRAYRRVWQSRLELENPEDRGQYRYLEYEDEG